MLRSVHHRRYDGEGNDVRTARVSSSSSSSSLSSSLSLPSECSLSPGKYFEVGYAPGELWGNVVDDDDDDVDCGGGGSSNGIGGGGIKTPTTVASSPAVSRGRGGAGQKAVSSSSSSSSSSSLWKDKKTKTKLSQGRDAGKGEGRGGGQDSPPSPQRHCDEDMSRRDDDGHMQEERLLHPKDDYDYDHDYGYEYEYDYDYDMGGGGNSDGGDGGGDDDGSYDTVESEETPDVPLVWPVARRAGHGSQPPSVAFGIDGEQAASLCPGGDDDDNCGSLEIRNLVADSGCCYYDHGRGGGAGACYDTDDEEMERASSCCIGRGGGGGARRRTSQHISHQHDRQQHTKGNSLLVVDDDGDDDNNDKKKKDVGVDADADADNGAQDDADAEMCSIQRSAPDPTRGRDLFTRQPSAGSRASLISDRSAFNPTPSFLMTCTQSSLSASAAARSVPSPNTAAVASTSATVVGVGPIVLSRTGSAFSAASSFASGSAGRRPRPAAANANSVVVVVGVDGLMTRAAGCAAQLPTGGAVRPFGRVYSSSPLEANESVVLPSASNVGAALSFHCYGVSPRRFGRGGNGGGGGGGDRQYVPSGLASPADTMCPTVASASFHGDECMSDGGMFSERDAFSDRDVLSDKDVMSEQDESSSDKSFEEDGCEDDEDDVDDDGPRQTKLATTATTTEIGRNAAAASVGPGDGIPLTKSDSSGSQSMPGFVSPAYKFTPIDSFDSSRSASSFGGLSGAPSTIGGSYEEYNYAGGGGDEGGGGYEEYDYVGEEDGGYASAGEGDSYCCADADDAGDSRFDSVTPEAMLMMTAAATTTMMTTTVAATTTAMEATIEDAMAHVEITRPEDQFQDGYDHRAAMVSPNCGSVGSGASSTFGPDERGEGAGGRLARLCGARRYWNDGGKKVRAESCGAASTAGAAATGGAGGDDLHWSLFDLPLLLSRCICDWADHPASARVGSCGSDDEDEIILDGSFYEPETGGGEWSRSNQQGRLRGDYYQRSR